MQHLSPSDAGRSASEPAQIALHKRFGGAFKRFVFYLALPLRFLFGDDIFISYSRSDGMHYAQRLASKLTRLGYSCRVDLWVTTPGKKLPGNLKRAIRWSKVFVLVGSEGAATSTNVAAEIDEFSLTKGPLVAIQFNFPLEKSPWFSRIEGLPLAVESNSAVLTSGSPSNLIVRRISDSFTFVRRNQRVRRFFVTAAVSLAALIILDVIAARSLAAAITEKKRQGELAEAATQKVTLIGQQLTDLNVKVQESQNQLNRLSGDLKQAKTDLTTAKNETQTEKHRADEARRSFEVAKKAERALGIGELANSEVANDPTAGLRLAEYSLSLGQNAPALKALERAYNGEDLFYGHLFRYARDSDLSSDGKQVLLNDYDSGTARVVNLATDSTAVTLHHARESLEGARFVANGERYLTWTKDSKWHLWSRSGAPIKTIQASEEEEDEPVTLCAGETVAVRGGKGVVDVWDLNTEQYRQIKIITSAQQKGDDDNEEVETPEEVSLIRCSPDHQTFLESGGSSKHGSRVWTFSGEQLYRIRADAEEADFAPAGGWLVTTVRERAWLWKDGKEVGPLDSHESDIISVLFSPDGTMLLVTSLDGLTRGYPFDAKNGPGQSFEFAKSDRSSDVVAFSPDSQTVLLGRRNGIVSGYDRNGKLLFTMPGHPMAAGSNGSIEKASFSADGKTIMTVDFKNVTRIWQPESRPFRFFGVPKDTRLQHFALSPSGDRVALEIEYANDRSEVQIYDLRGGPIRTLTGFHSSLYSLNFSKNGRRLIAGSRERIMISTEGSEPITIEAEAARPFIGHVMLSPDEQSIVFWHEEILATIGETLDQEKHPFLKSKAWTLAGTPLPPPSAETLRALKNPVQMPPPLATTIFSDADFSRSTEGIGFWVKASASPDRFWLPAKLQEPDFTVAWGPNNLGYLGAVGHNGAEIFLIDPKRILRDLNDNPVYSIWKLDKKAQQQYRLGR